MSLYRASGSDFESLPVSSFQALELRERQDLQRLIRRRLDVFGEDLLLIAEEYGLFADSKRRIDILALDRNGSLVVVELKRTGDGGHMELQALRYAAMVSTMSYTQMIDSYASTHSVDAAAARAAIGDWIADADTGEQLADTVRIILASQDFSTEVTSTVLWLNEHYGTAISCFRMTPYAFGEEVLLDIAQIIPLPEAADFRIQQRSKGVARSAATLGVSDSSRDYTKYDVRVGGFAFEGVSKQNAVKSAVIELVRAGVRPSVIRAALTPRRWFATHPNPDEDVRSAFEREYPDKSTGYWFDIRMIDDGGTWVMPRLGGRLVENHLTALESVAEPATTMTWKPASSVEAGSPETV